MKNYIYIIFISITAFLSACHHSNATDDTSASTVERDSVAVARVIHDFYKWYDHFITNDAINFNITNDEGEHLTLNQKALDAYLATIKKSGFVNDTFIQGEYAYYKKCEQLWQNEDKGDVPSGMDADKYFCAQDYDITFYTEAPVRIQSLGANQIAATMYQNDTEYPMERHFELQKENGKWYISKIECDMGIE